MVSSPNKTVANQASVDDFLNSLADSEQAEDGRKLIEIFERVTGKKPVMWGGAMVGFGHLRMMYSSGRKIEWFQVGFSPRKGKTTLSVTFEADKLTGQFPELGKYKTGKGCIYIRRLSDVDLDQLEKLITVAFEQGWQSPTRADGKEQTVTVEVVS